MVKEEVCKVKLMQLNCWGGKLGTQLQRLIAEEKPDIVCLGEATDLAERPGSVLDPYRKFLPEADYPYDIFAPAFSYRYMHELAGLGNAVVSKFKIESEYIEFVKNHFMEDIDSVDSDDYNNRNFVHATIKTDKGLINVLTHHGHHSPHGKDGSVENTEQILKLTDYIDKLDGPIILTGDFNLHPNSKSLEPIHKTLRNLPTEFKLKTTRTELAKREEVIDYIFVNDDIKVLDFFTSNILVSDHKALILEFDLVN